jgi:hypothetical protein
MTNLKIQNQPQPQNPDGEEVAEDADAALRGCAVAGDGGDVAGPSPMARKTSRSMAALRAAVR